MNKKIYILIITLLIINLGIFLYFFVFYHQEKKIIEPRPITLNCAQEGENFSRVYKDKYPEHCCDGLTEWFAGMDTRISIVNECYKTMREGGNPVGVCINCGNGICESIENVCNCPNDCGAENSKYTSIDDFCADYAGTWLAMDCENFNHILPICNICK